MSAEVGWKPGAITAGKFVGSLREPHYRIGVLQATLRHTKEDIDRAAALLNGTGNDIAREILSRRAADLANTLDLIAKADGE